jgi:cell division septation protein DedD
MKLALLALLLTAGTAGLAANPSVSNIAAIQAKAQAGDAAAEFQLGEAYRTGRGVTADPESAIMWYRRAAAQGHIRASEELGFALFAHGDRREAMPYIEKAAARGEARAFYLLGTAHFNGDYASRDWPLAYAQTMRAAAAGLPAAQRNLELMDHYLLPSDKAKADQILATLPSVRTGMPADAASALAPPAPSAGTVAAPSPARIAAQSAGTKPAKPAKAAKPAPETPADAVSKPAADGAWKVQLGAFGTADRAQDRWKSLKAKVPALAAYPSRVVAAGSIQRLQATGIASKADAQTLCKKVVAAGGDCLVMAP